MVCGGVPAAVHKGCLVDSAVAPAVVLVLIAASRHSGLCPEARVAGTPHPNIATLCCSANEHNGRAVHRPWNTR